MRRLRTDYIDIYHIHWPDPLVELNESASVLLSLIEEQKIRSIGLSNFSVEQMKSFIKEVQIQFCQPPYNIFERDIEQDILPFCKENNINILSYGVLCRGLLSGKMEPGTEFKTDDLRRNDPKFNFPNYKNYLLAVKKMNELALSNYDKNIIHLAARWVLDNGADIAIWGARKSEQLKPVNEIWDFKIDEPVLKEIDEIIKTTIENPVGSRVYGFANKILVNITK